MPCAPPPWRSCALIGTCRRYCRLEVQAIRDCRVFTRATFPATSEEPPRGSIGRIRDLLDHWFQRAILRSRSARDAAGRAWSARVRAPRHRAGLARRRLSAIARALSPFSPRDHGGRCARVSANAVTLVWPSKSSARAARAIVARRQAGHRRALDTATRESLPALHLRHAPRHARHMIFHLPAMTSPPPATAAIGM